MANPLLLTPARNPTPNNLPVWSVVSGQLESGNTETDNVATFFTGAAGSLDRTGTALSSNWTATVFKTIVSVTGAGSLSTIIGPTLATAADTFTARVTIDGVVYTLAAAASAENTSRIVVGAMFTVNWSTTANRQLVMRGGAAVGGISQWVLNTATPQYLDAAEAWARGTPMVRFERSLLVEGATSQNITATVNQERYAGVSYFRTS